MATGHPTADLAVILIDGQKDPPQTRPSRLHRIAARISNVLAASTKWTAGYREDVFRKLQDDFVTLAASWNCQRAMRANHALEGDNVVDRSKRMPWYHGPTLLEHLETVLFRKGFAARLSLPGTNRDSS